MPGDCSGHTALNGAGKAASECLPYEVVCGRWGHKEMILQLCGVVDQPHVLRAATVCAGYFPGWSSLGPPGAVFCVPRSGCVTFTVSHRLGTMVPGRGQAGAMVKDLSSVLRLWRSCQQTEAEQ